MAIGLELLELLGVELEERKHVVKQEGFYMRLDEYSGILIEDDRVDVLDRVEESLVGHEVRLMLGNDEKVGLEKSLGAVLNELLRVVFIGGIVDVSEFAGHPVRNLAGESFKGPGKRLLSFFNFFQI